MLVFFPSCSASPHLSSSCRSLFSPAAVALLPSISTAVPSHPTTASRASHISRSLLFLFSHPSTSLSLRHCHVVPLEYLFSFRYRSIARKRQSEGLKKESTRDLNEPTVDRYSRSSADPHDARTHTTAAANGHADTARCPEGRAATYCGQTRGSYMVLLNNCGIFLLISATCSFASS